MAEIIAGTFGHSTPAPSARPAFRPPRGRTRACRAICGAHPAVEVDTRTNALLAGATPLFIGVEVQAATQTRGASRATLDRFVAHFYTAMRAADRRYTLDEIIAVAQATLGNVSVAEIEAALRRSPVSARAGAGRRAAHEVPTEAELAAAASRAVEASSNPA